MLMVVGVDLGCVTPLIPHMTYVMVYSHGSEFCMGLELHKVTMSIENKQKKVL